MSVGRKHSRGDGDSELHRDHKRVLHGNSLDDGSDGTKPNDGVGVPRSPRQATTGDDDDHPGGLVQDVGRDSGKGDQRSRGVNEESATVHGGDETKGGVSDYSGTTGSHGVVADSGKPGKASGSAVDLQPGLGVCLNCGNSTKGVYSYQGVVVCGACAALAQMCDKRAVKQCLDLLTVYRESLRVSLASGRLKPSEGVPNGKSKVTSMPKKEDLANVLGGIAKILDKSAKDKTNVGGRDRGGVG